MSAALPFFEVVDRRVLFVVELIDPVTRLCVSDRLKVKAAGLDKDPVVNLSRRFVWLEEGDKWPSKVSISSGDPRFAPTEQPAKPRPQSLSDAKAKERLLTVVLPTTPAYQFESGITAIRGSLYEKLATQADPRRGPPVAGATVALAYRGHAGANTPDEYVRPPFSVTTDAAGQFAVFVKLVKKPGFDFDIVPPSMLKVRIEVERGLEKRGTAPDFKFSGDPQVPSGRIREGQVLPESVLLGWTDLNKV